MSLKTYNTESDEIIIKFMDQNGTPLKIEPNLIWNCLLKNRNDAIFYRT